MNTARNFFVGVLCGGILLTTTIPIFADISTGTNTSLSVPPKASNYQLAVTSDVGGGPIAQGSDIIYTMTYGASSSAAFITNNNTITVDYSQDTYDGINHVADYVYGSATNGYGGAEPIVDVINRKITWNISQIPPGTTDQVVTFKMKTNSNYTGSSQIPMITTAQFSNQYATLNTSLTVTYGFHISLPGPSAPTPTPTPVTTSPITPPITPTSLIDTIDFNEITPTTMTLSISTTQKTRLSVFYGLSQNLLSQISSDTTLRTTHTVQLAKLTPATKYYLKVIATTEAGVSMSSDILTATTAKNPSLVHVDQNSIILVSGNNPLVNTNPLLPFAQVLIPNKQTYTVGLRVSSHQNIKNIVALVENAHVLGVNTFTQNDNANIWSAPMLEEQPGIYIAQLLAPPTPSIYDVFAKISDKNGNIIQTKIAEAIVYGPLKVIDTNSKKGIEHARIAISIYNPDKKSYEPILSSYIQQNPTFTDKNGLAQINNGAGKYKISVSQYDYQTQNLYFTIDKSHLYPPTISLRHVGFTIEGFAQYYANTTSDFFQQLFAGLQDISNTTRFFKLISMIVIISLVIVTFLLFMIRTKLSLMVIPLFIKHHTTKSGVIHGQILDALTHKPITLAVIAISSKATHEIIATTTSSNKGIFYLKPEWVISENNMNILAQGYRTNKFALNNALFPAAIYLHHNLVGGPLHNPFVASLISFAGLLFETLLVVSFILELFFTPTIGLFGSIFVILSLFNLLLWILYQKGE